MRVLLGRVFVVFTLSGPKTKIIISSVIAVFAATAMALATNYFVMIPLYIKAIQLGRVTRVFQAGFIFLLYCRSI